MQLKKDLLDKLRNKSIQIDQLFQVGGISIQSIFDEK